MSPSVTFLTATDDPTGADDEDKGWYERAAATAGIDLTFLPWDTAPAALAASDLVVFRSVWDYHHDWARFTAALDGLQTLGVVHNPVPVVRWNGDKRYMAQLETMGIAVVPTTFVTSVNDARSALAGFDTGDQVVVKPTVSAGSRDTGLFTVGDTRALELASLIVASDRVAMIQPAIPSVSTDGEIAMIYLDGDFSHAASKGPLLAPGGGLIGGTYAEQIDTHTPSAAVRSLADSVVDAVHQLAWDAQWLPRGERLLYARIDVATTDTGPVLLEAELFEPSLFLATSPNAADRFMAAIVARIRSA